MQSMKLLASVAAVLLALTACEKNQPSKLDTVEKELPKETGAASGSLEQRVARLERYSEALDFLQKVYDQQKQQQEEAENRDPAPDAMFAVDISQNVQLGMIEGPTVAPVTIVEAWDFA
jgi:hypothetical protein